MNKRISFLFAFLALGSMPALAMEREVKRARVVSQDELNKQLIEAASDGNLETVQDVINRGAHINAVDTSGCTALMKAVARRRKEVVNFLIQAGADVNRPDANTLTPCMLAAFKGDNKMVEILIHAGADLYAKDGYGLTALMIAARWEHSSTCQLLVEAMLSRSPSKQACAAYFCMKNIPGNIFDSIKDPVCERICTQQNLVLKKILEEIIKIDNDKIRQALIDKCFCK